MQKALFKSGNVCYTITYEEFAKERRIMRKLLRFLKPYTKETILGPLFKLLEATFELFIPLVVAAIVDTGIGSGDSHYIFKT